MTNEEQKLREFAAKWMDGVVDQDANDEWRPFWPDFLADLTALISEGYVSKEEHDKVVQQRDELREALQNLMDATKRLPPFSGIVGTLEKQYKQAEAAIKNTDG